MKKEGFNLLVETLGQATLMADRFRTKSEEWEEVALLLDAAIRELYLLTENEL
jgi:hypothetical protein